MEKNIKKRIVWMHYEYDSVFFHVCEKYNYLRILYEHISIWMIDLILISHNNRDWQRRRREAQRKIWNFSFMINKRFYKLIDLIVASLAQRAFQCAKLMASRTWTFILMKFGFDNSMPFYHDIYECKLVLPLLCYFGYSSIHFHVACTMRYFHYTYVRKMAFLCFFVSSL